MKPRTELRCKWCQLQYENVWHHLILVDKRKAKKTARSRKSPVKPSILSHQILATSHSPLVFFIFVFPLLCSASHSPPPPRVSLHPSQCQPPLPLFSKRCGQSQEARRALNPGAALTPLGRVTALICANLRHSLWHILTQICTSWDCKHAQAWTKNKDTERPRLYSTKIERANKWAQMYIQPVPRRGNCKRQNNFCTKQCSRIWSSRS